MNKTTKIASFAVDPQRGFTPICPDELPVPGGDQIVPDLNFMATLADLRVASKDAHSPLAKWVVGSKDYMLRPTGLPEADVTWVSHCVPGTKGFEFIDGLPAPLDFDFVVYKGVELDMHPYGACYHDLGGKQSTGVIEYLKYNGVTRVLVGGLALEYCVATTAMQLLKAGFEVVLYLPSCRPIDDAAGAEAVVAMREAGITIANTENELTIAANA